MTTPSSPGRPPKTAQQLSKQLILRTALPILQKSGVDALSFRVIADELGVTPMAVTYHTGSKKELLSDLVALAFANTLKGASGDTPLQKARNILATYCKRALENANLLRAILEDVSLMSDELYQITAELKSNTQKLENGDDGDVLVHLLIDYTHGFVLSASSGENNPLTFDGFLKGVDWVLAQAAGK